MGVAIGIEDSDEEGNEESFVLLTCWQTEKQSERAVSSDLCLRVSWSGLRSQNRLVCFPPTRESGKSGTVRGMASGNVSVLVSSCFTDSRSVCSDQYLAWNLYAMAIFEATAAQRAQQALCHHRWRYGY